MTLSSAAPDMQEALRSSSGLWSAENAAILSASGVLTTLPSM
jgi:hypothetical protein